MNTPKKTYTSPAITSESSLEQTSLACNVTIDPSSPDLPDGAFAGEGFCTENVAKGGLFFDEFSCDVVDEDIKEFVAAS